ncbi:hypothetical protein OVS_03910 [Mycoplasma ovis str. Michigan]|uniref:Chromosome partition protein Smc n=1 Tax=Mycoplasma ovis str. Michigan TaxID=1415773 RepID=A0ABM5P211_9MOLU|nr:hypothetical protein [Mycoplasma ovis]AHC40513.1 hypothetical protein OVS_03910 [Mycoplasma ovis str. Michigan]
MSGWKTMLLGGAGGLLFGGSTVGVVFRGGNQPVPANVTAELESKGREITQLEADLLQKIEYLKNEQTKHEKDIQEKENLLKGLESQQEELQKLTEDLDNKKEEVENTKKSLEQLKRAKSDYQKTKQQLWSELKKKGVEISTITKEKSSLERVKNQLQEKNVRIQKEVQQLQETVKQVSNLQKLEMIVKGLEGNVVPKEQVQEIKDREQKLLSLRSNAKKELRSDVARMLDRLVSDLESRRGIWKDIQDNTSFKDRLKGVINAWKTTKK